MLCTKKELFQNLKENANVFLHSAVCNPTPLVELICDAALNQGIKKLNFFHLHIDGEAVHLRKKYKGFVEVNCFFVGPNCRDAIRTGQASYVPIFLSQISELFRNGSINIDYALIQVSEFDKHGYATLGPSVDISVSALHQATKVIAMINPKMPKVLGEGVVHKSNLNSWIEHDMQLPQHAPKLPSEISKKIGFNVANLVDNGSTLQLGIGDIPNAVLAELTHHKNLGVHTEMFSDGLLPLVRSEVINNKLKKIHPHRVVSSFAMGSQDLYDFLDDNPIVQFMGADFVNDPRIILKNPKVCAINSAIEIDLSGQICADSIGSKIFSGVGGQVDFMRGAALSPGGKAIIAIPTRTRTGKSKIVFNLALGSGVVTTRAHVQWVVTEYGSTNLMGKSISQRAKALIEISHPDDRDKLEKEYFEYKR